jgi:hypothetical protein
MKDPILQVVKFCNDRKLPEMEFNPLDYTTNIVEELAELHGLKVTKEMRPRLKEITEMLLEVLEEEFPKAKEDPYKEIDAINDIRVFSIDANLKLGFNPKKSLLETAKEINSREGEIVDGKFQKFTTPEAKSKWYKADYEKTRR